MLPEFEWPWRIGAAALALGLVAALAVRAARKDRREYSRFRRYRSTAKRQAMLRRWLIESAVLFGGSALVLLAIVHPLLGALLATAQATAPVTWLRDALAGGLGIGLLLGALLGITALTLVGARSARREGGVIMVGDIAALLPRNRPELAWGAALSVNAGIVEEALFRLALPALLVVATGEPLSAFALAALVFGLLHLYQGALGVVATTMLGLGFSALYVVSGSIVLVMVLHALLDLRTLVLIPVTVYRVHRLPGSVRFPPVVGRASTQPAAETSEPVAPTSGDAAPPAGDSGA